MAKITINKPGKPVSVSVNAPGEGPTVIVNPTHPVKKKIFNSTFNKTFA